jgi:class 3 adenylate cyclase
MDATTLEQKTKALAHYPEIGEPLARRFAQIVSASDDWGLFRVNPLLFGQTHDLPAAQAISLFIHAARVGLFDFDFNQLCAYCGGVEYSYEGLGEISDSFFCTTCNVKHDCTLDDRLEVSFTISPAVHVTKIDAYANPDSYGRVFFSANIERRPEVAQLMAKHIRDFVTIAADAAREITFEAKAGEHWVLLSADTHSKVAITVEDGAPTTLGLGYHPYGPEVRALKVGPGPVRLKVINSRPETMAVFFGTEMIDDLMALGQKSPAAWRPYLTGKMLLNNQSFRDLFRVQTLAPDLKLTLKSLTLLFTDLKGSTELYDRTGDVYAYQVVQEHFRVLSNAVRRHEGAIVKTMGDAIMASFSNPRDAVGAAVEMMKAMEAVNAKVKADGHETGLKVGVHEGSALAVNAESRLDYFGQTVNIAARVQALAASGEIWITESVAKGHGVSPLLEGAGFKSESKVVSLKGVGAPTPVFRWA